MKGGDSVVTCIPFYKVIVLHVNMFETTILDERHFPTRPEAETFAAQYRDRGGGNYYNSVYVSILFNV